MAAQPGSAVISIIGRDLTSLDQIDKTLSQAGYRVLTCTSHSAEITQFQQQSDLIILDISAANSPDVHLYHQWKSDPYAQRIPLILLLPLPEMKTEIARLSLDTPDYIAKPLQSNELVARVQLQLQIRDLIQALDDKDAQLQRQITRTASLEEHLEICTNVLQGTTTVLEALKDSLRGRGSTIRELRQSQEYFRQFAENIESVFWMTNLEKDQMLYLSPAYERIWGWPVEEVYQSSDSWVKAIHPEDRDRVMAAFPKQAQGTYNEDYRIIRSNGELRWIRDRAFPICDETGQIYRIAGIAEDVTSYKQIEETLQLQERAISASLNGIVIADARLPDAPTIYVNAAFERITGYSASEAVGQNCRFLQGADIDQPALYELRTSLQEGQGCTVTLRNYRKDGTLFWNELSLSPLYDEWGTLTHYVGIQNDITRRKQAEESLTQQLAAIEAAIDGIAILDAQGRYIYLNSAHVQLFAYTDPEELLGQPWQQLYAPEEIERFQRDIFPALGRDHHWQGEATAIRKDGSTFAEEVSLTLIENGGLVCVCRDISDRKQAEANLKASLHEKELLLKEIHHRVKNNLLVVSSLLDWQTDYFEDPAILKMIGESQSRIQTMALIHEKLYQSANLARIDFSEYLETLAKQLLFALDRDHEKIQLIFELESVYLNIETATPCGLIVSELISNVFEHAFPDDQEGKLWIKITENESGQIKVIIQDNGVGFPESLDFQTVESLGLQLVYLLTQQLEGTIQINRNQGTTFCLIFSELQYRNRI